MFARLILKTKDGALLNENDVIMNIIVNNEELVGEILELNFPPLKERFELACEDKKISRFFLHKMFALFIEHIFFSFKEKIKLRRKKRNLSCFSI